jgi:predicted nuclease of predicted toxin-antitoxin system
MSAIKFYTDEHVARAVVHGLRLRDIDVLTVQEANMMGATDKAHLLLAIREERVIFTQDADFLRLHAQGIEHAGIIYASQHTSVGRIVRVLVSIYQTMQVEEMRNSVRFV